MLPGGGGTGMFWHGLKRRDGLYLSIYLSTPGAVHVLKKEMNYRPESGNVVIAIIRISPAVVNRARARARNQREKF